jgi:ankyrin repeat protein
MICEDDILEILHRACGEGMLNEVCRILDQGAKINDAITDKSQTALFYAAARGHADICTLLIERGAKVNNEKSNEFSPLSAAVFWNHKEVCSVLLHHGADSNQYDSGGRTPLTIGSWLGYFEICDLLLGYGADVNLPQKSDGWLPLMLSTSNERMHTDIDTRVETCTVLLNHGANINLMNNFGRTTLMEVAFRGDEEICKFLLEHGANLQILDITKRTAIDIATEQGHQSIVNILKCWGTCEDAEYFSKENDDRNIGRI